MIESSLSFGTVFPLFIVGAVVGNMVLGLLVLYDSPRRKINRIFSCLCLTLSLWGISFLGLNFSVKPLALEIWSRFYAASLLFIPPLFYHLVLGSIGHPSKGHRIPFSEIFDRIKQLAYVFSAGWLVLTLAGIFPQTIVHTETLAFPNIGQFWVAMLVYGVLASISVGLLLRHAMLAKDPTQKSRLFYLLVGALTIIGGGILSIFFVHAFRIANSWLIGMGHGAALLSMMLVAYALTTNQLYHFSEVFRKAIAFLSMTTILIVVFGGTHFIARQLLVPYIPRSDFFALGIASIIMSLLFHPLRFRVQNVVDRIFFTQRYDQMQRLRSLARRVLSSADRDELLNVLFTSLKGIGFGSVTLLLKDPQKPMFYIKKTQGLSDDAQGFFLRTDSLLIQYLREEKEELIRDDVLRRIMADWERQALADEMDILKSEISFPIFSTRRRALFGVVTLGDSDLGYSSYVGRNIFWLKSVIDNAGIMLDNFYHHDLANALIPYVGRAWADEMRINKEGFRERLAGQRTWVSVLMVDIRHFTNLSSRMDPTEVVQLLKDFRSVIAPVVYRHQGTIDKFIGDAVMIVFGLPILPKLDNPDKNAVECARSIMDEIGRLNQKRVEAERKDRITIGIGVSSGEVIAGNVDSGDRVEYTVIGDAANMVARLEDLAGDNQILISPATYGRVKETTRVNAWEPRHITGFDEPITVYELAEPNQINILKPPQEGSENDRLAANQ